MFGRDPNGRTGKEQAKISNVIEQIDHVVHRLRALQARKKHALGEANAHEYCVIAPDEAFDALQEAVELLGQYKRYDVTPEQAKNASRWVAMTPSEKNAVYDRIEDDASPEPASFTGTARAR